MPYALLPFYAFMVWLLRLALPRFFLFLAFFPRFITFTAPAVRVVLYLPYPGSCVGWLPFTLLPRLLAPLPGWLVLLVTG